MADSNEQNPWTRPGWIISAVVVAVVLVLGIVITITTARGGDDDAATGDPTRPITVTPTPPDASDPGEESVCGIGTVQLDGAVSEAPDAEWAYEGTTAYPTSDRHGPGETAENGVRTCFEHSPTGALFMAANAVAQGGAATSMEWATVALAEGTYRDELLGSSASSGGTSDLRLTIGGFRILDYSGDTARVDIGLSTFANGSTRYFSGVYELVWQSGDWLISTESMTGVSLAEIESLTGYTPWGQ